MLAKGGGETEKQIYRFQKGDADLSLRFDLTVPLAKYVALHYSVGRLTASPSWRKSVISILSNSGSLANFTLKL